MLQLFFLEILVNAASISSTSGEAIGSLGSLDSLEPKNQGLDKRQSVVFPILGAQSMGRRCYPRLNIEVLQRQDPDQFNMLLLAFYDVQNYTGPDNDLSWFRVAGIHGAPYITWKQLFEEGPFNTNLGYGYHNSPMFSIWHRPYLLLMEQLLQETAVRIANRFRNSDRFRYRAAADRLRLPYIDWSDITYQGRIPDFVMTPEIAITWPTDSGMSETIMVRNPLYQYNFRVWPWYSEVDELPARWRPYLWTIRTAPKALLDLIMSITFITRRQNTFNLFTRARFNTFSAQSEAIHNSINSYLGLGGNGPIGHIASPEVAAFDPIFWLHHANLDRLTAMYQVLYPNNRLTPVPARPTYGRLVPGRDGPQDNLDTNLYPFRKADGTFYKARDFVSGRTGLWRYHYSYPEISCDSRIPRPQVVRNVRQAINALYGPVSESPIRRRQNETVPEPPAEGPIPGEESGYPPSGGEVGMVRNEYSLRLFIDLAEMVGLWTCHIFLGAVPSLPANYSASPNRCGVFAPFSAPGQRMESMAYTYDFALTDELLSLGVSPNSTETYLTDNLKYVIVSETGLIVDPSSLRTFKAGICTTQGKYGKPGSDKLASFGDCTVLYEITEDKPGGVTSADELYDPILLDGTSADLNATLEQF